MIDSKLGVCSFKISFRHSLKPSKYFIRRLNSCIRIESQAGNELGQVVNVQIVNDAVARLQLNVEDLPRGVYHLLFINEQGVSITRSVILN